MYVVTVLFNIKVTNFAEFLAAVTENARLSLANEPGCEVFDVCQSPADRPCQVFLYEVYVTQADFQLHLSAPHFHYFNSLTASWVVDKTVSIFQLTTPSP